MPLVTINIPTYARDESLRRAIRSALDQTVPDLEVNVSDNAPSPATLEVVKSFDDPRLSYFPLDRNIGLHGNLTRCLHLGRSPFVLMLHDDDVLYPECIEVLLDALHRAPAAGIAHSAMNYIDGDGKITVRNVNWTDASADQYERGSEFIDRTMSSAVRIAFSAALMRREAVCSERADAGDKSYCDLGLWLRIAKSWDVAFVNRPLVGLAIHTGSSSAEQGWQHRDVDGNAYVSADGISPHQPRESDDRRSQVATVRDVKLKFVREHLPESGARRRAMARIRRWARHELKLIVADSLDRQSSWATIRHLNDSARIEPSVLLTPWPLLLSVAGLMGRGPYDRFVAWRSRS